MSGQDAPFVLIIDDKPDEEMGRAAVLTALGLNAAVRTPEAVTIEDISRAALIAVDEYLDWPAGALPREPVFSPIDGLAVVRVLQRHAWAVKSAPSFVLRSGELAKLGERLPAEIREPALAAQHDLDWAFNKQDSNEGRRIADLAAATHALRQSFGSDIAWEDGAIWLGLGESDWSETALSQVHSCRPPERAVADYTSGSSWLRWFSQRILPYPAFLLSDLHAALRLRLTLRDFSDLISSESPLAHRISEYKYVGHLDKFMGRRWWRAGIDSFVDSLLAGADWEKTEADILRAALSEIHGAPVPVITEEHPVSTMKADYSNSGEIIDSSNAVRISPDLWPVFADEPWASIDDALHDEQIENLISRDDRVRFRDLKGSL